jgi:L-malate glycosyltransferase
MPLEGNLNFKVTILTPGELFGGVERQVVDLCGAAQLRDDVQYRTMLFHDHTLAQELKDQGTEPTFISARHRYDPSAASRVAHLIQHENIQVVHAHGYRPMVTLATASMFGKLLPPIVKTEHGLPEPSPGQLLTTLKTGLNHRLDRWATHRLKATVCYVTDDIRSHYDHQHSGLQRHTVHNGIVPLERQSFSRPADLPAEGLVLGIVGRISEVKGISDALEAMSLDDMPRNVQFVILGTGPLSASLEAQAKSLGLGDRVHFLGFRRNIFDYLAHIDGLLMPSLHEGLPYTLLEAMSLGRAVLASDVGGLAEVIEHGKTGFLFPPRDPQAIAHACCKLVENDELTGRLGEAAALAQREQYTLEAMLTKYLDIYQEASERGSGLK